MPGDLHHVPQKPVDAVAHLHPGLVGLQVDVAGLLGQGLLQDEVHQAHPRGIPQVFLGRFFLFRLLILVILKELLGAEGNIPGPLVGFQNLLFRGHQGLDDPPREALQIVDHVDIQRIGHGHKQDPILDIHGQHMPGGDHLGRDQIHNLRRKIAPGQIHPLDHEMLAEGIGHLAGGDEI